MADTVARQTQKRGEGKHEKHDEFVQKINERTESWGW